MRTSLRLLVPALLCAPLLARSAPVPKVLGYEGRLAKDGVAAAGVVDVRFAIYPTAEGGGVLWEEDQKLALTDGLYATYLGSVVPLRDDVFDGSDRFLEFTVGTEVLTPRQRLASVGYALRADVAMNLAGGTVDATSISVGGHTVIDASGRLAQGTGYEAGSGIVIDTATNTISLPSTCTSSQVLKWNGAGWVCGAAGASYAAGSGLDLNGGVFSLTSGCLAGQLLKWDGASWTCANDLNARVTVADGSGLELNVGALSLNSQCSEGQILKYDGTRWACAADANTGSLTGVAAQAPLTATAAGGLATLSLPAGSATTNGYLAATDWVRFEAGQKLQGNGVAATAPATGQALKWNGTAWAPAADADSGGTVTSVGVATGTPISVANGTSTPTLSMAAATSVSAGYLSAADWATFSAKLGAGSAAAGDLSGTYPGPSVAKLQGNALSAATPATGQVLAWNGSAWAPATPTGGTVTSVSASGPLSVANGTTTPTLSLTQASSVSAGYLSAADWAAFDGKLASGANAGGDLIGALPNPTVARLRTIPLASTAPTTGQLLTFNGTAWTPGGASDIGAITGVTTAAGTPLSVTNGTSTPTLSISAASATSAGYLSAADWNAFSGKIGSGASAGGDLAGTLPSPSVAKLQGNAVSGATPTSGQVLKWFGAAWAPGSDNDTITSVTATGPLSVANGSSAPAISISQATATTAGYLSAADWTVFNGKGVGTVANVSGSGPVSVANGSTSPAISITRATSVSDGYLSSTDWAAFNAKGSGTVTSVSGSGPISVANGTTTPVLSINQANAVTAGFLTASDWVTFNGKLGTSSAAGGDVSGTFGALTVARLQGSPVAATSPAGGQVLAWNGGAWAPATPTSGTVTSVSGSGAISVASGSTTPVVAIADASSSVKGAMLAGTGLTASAGTVAVAYGTTAGTALQGNQTFAGDVTGSVGALTVAKLQGNAVAATTPTGGQVLTWNVASSSWVPATPSMPPSLVWSTGVVDLGTIAIADGSANATLTNAGPSSVSGLTIRVAGGFTESDICSTLAAGASCTVTFGYSLGGAVGTVRDFATATSTGGSAVAGLKVVNNRTGSSAATAGLQCNAIHTAASSAPDGAYWIDPDGAGGNPPYQVWCDMTTDGGGWTMAMGVVPNDGDVVRFTNTLFWTNNAEYGSFLSVHTNDYKSPAAWTLAATRILIEVTQQGPGAPIIGWKEWVLSGTKTLGQLFVDPTNTVETTSSPASSLASVDPWEPLLKNGVQLIANRLENPNNDRTRLGTTGRTNTPDDNEPGLGTEMNEASGTDTYRFSDVELYENTAANIWCTVSGGPGSYHWLGTDTGCGVNCGSCQSFASPGYGPAWNYRILMR